MLYILFGNAAQDTDEILNASKSNRSVSWVVPKSSQTGERALFYLPRYGFVARGEIASTPKRARARRYEGDVRNLTALRDFVPLSFVRDRHKKWKWPTYPRSYTIIDGAIESRLEALLSQYREHARLTEGAVKRALVNKYERNSVARRECIRKYGDSCFVCGFSFGRVYGAVAEGFIHVHHHLAEVAGRGGEHEVDPIRDLRPICPNCHAVAHLQTPPISISKLKTMRKRSGAQI
jgi:hypothetical protein